MKLSQGLCRAACVAALLALAQPMAGGANAEPVALDGGRGQGFAFRSGQTCYILLPSHVHGRRRSIAFSTLTPLSFSTATVVRDRVGGADLSFAVAAADFMPRCRTRWQDIRGSAELDPARLASALLQRITAAGDLERVRMTITGIAGDRIFARTSDAEAEIFQGVSGSMLMHEGHVLGMAIQSPNVREGEFLSFRRIRTELEMVFGLEERPRVGLDPEIVPSLPRDGVVLPPRQEQRSRAVDRYNRQQEQIRPSAPVTTPAGKEETQ